MEFQIGTRIAPLLAVWYKNSLDEQRAKQEATRKSADRMVNQMLWDTDNNYGLVFRQWDEGKQHLEPALGPDLYKEKFSELQTLAGMHAVKGAQAAGMPTQAAPQQPAQPAQPSQPDMGIPSMNPTPAPAPTAQQPNQPPTDPLVAYAQEVQRNAPPMFIPQTTYTQTADGGLTRSKHQIQNPAWEIYQKDAFMGVYVPLLANMSKQDAYDFARRATGYAYPVNPTELGWTYEESFKKFTKNLLEADTQENRDLFQRNHPDINVNSSMGTNLYNLLLADEISRKMGGFIPNELRAEMLGATGIAEERAEGVAERSAQRELRYAGKKLHQELDIREQDFLNKPIGETKPEIAEKAGLPLNTPTRQALGRILVPEVAKKNVDEIDRVTSILTELEALSKKIYRAEGGFKRFATGAKNYLEYIKQPEGRQYAAEYKRLRSALMNGLARNVNSDIGVLTDQDRIQFESGVPNLSDAKGFSQDTYDFLFRTLEKRRGYALRPATMESLESTKPTRGKPSGAAALEYLRSRRGGSR